MFKCEGASRRFQPGEGPIRDLLRDCDNRWIVCSSIVVLSSTSPGLGDVTPGKCLEFGRIFSCKLLLKITARTKKYLTSPSQY